MAVLNVDIIVEDNGSLAIRKVSEEAKKAEQSARSLKKSTDDLNSSNNKTSSSFTSLSNTMKGLGFAAVAYEMGKLSKQAVTSADEFKLLEARIRLVSDTSIDYAKTQRSLIDIANTSRTTFQSMGQLFVRLNSPIKELGGSVQTTTAIADSFSKTLLVSGASTQEATSATLQFAQAMGAGKLQGDEFRSMAENAPRILKVVSESLNVSSGALKQMASDGKLTSGVIGGALLESMTALTVEAKTFPNTVGGSFTILKNELGKTIETFDKAYGVTNKIAEAVNYFSDIVKNSSAYIKELDKEMDNFAKNHEHATKFLKLVYDTLVKIHELSLDKIIETLNALGELAKRSASGFVKWLDQMGQAAEYLGLIETEASKANRVLNTVPDRPFHALNENIKETIVLQKDENEFIKEQKRLLEALNAPAISEEEQKKLTRQERQTKALQEYKNLLDKTTMSSGQKDILANLLEQVQQKANKDADQLKANAEAQAKKASATKIAIGQLEAEISSLEKKYTINKQIEDLSIETALRNEKISSVEAEYLKERNDISSQLAKNQETINLLQGKYNQGLYEGQEADKDKAKDLQKINDLQKEDELLKRKLIAADERRQATIKAVNDELKSSIMSLDMSDIDKQYLSLSKEVANLVKDGADLKLVGEYATTIANQLAREDAYNHLQKELEIRKDTIELTMYGSEKETALESLRHEEVLANLQRELETRKVNYDEYLKLMNLEMTRHAQNADELRKFMLSAFDNIEKALDSSFFDAMQDKFKTFGSWLKSFFKNLGNSVAQGLSRTLAGGIVNSLRSSLFSNMGTGLTLGSLAVGSAVSASEISTIMNSGGTFDSATNTITTSGGTAIKLAENGTGTVDKGGTDILGVASMISSVKTAYDVLTAGISSSILTGFQGASGLLANAGMGGAASGLMSFGAGFANPFAYAGMSGLPTAMTIGSAASAGLLGGAVGYGTGWLGDKLFGANTYASMGGLAGGALGGIGASLGMFGGVPGIIIGSLLGSALGGVFGKKKETDSGIQFFKNLDSLDTLSNETVRAYQDWEKKGWFSKSSGTELSDLSSSQMKQIEAVFDTYDYLLVQLGDSDKIFLEAGKYSKDTFQDALAKNFIKAFTNIDQSVDSTIYQAWKDYAESINKTVTEALTSSINTFVSSSRDFEKWSLERQGKTLESLQKQSQWLTADFSNLANMLGATDVTVENYTQKYSEAIKNSFDPDTITKWQNLGTALRSATDAADNYKDAVLNQLNSQLTAWTSALGSIQSAIDNISPTFKSLDELKNSTVTLDNYSTLLSQLEATRQNEINTLTTAANARIEQLNNEKSLFQNLSSFIDELNLKLLGSNVTSDYFFSELDKAKATLKNGGVVDTSKLTASANSYLDSALQNSTSQLEYFRELAKVKDGIGSLGSMVTGGTLESVEAAIKTEEQTLASKLDALNQTALAILNGWKGTATSSIGSLTSQINTVKTVDPTITAAYANILGRAPEEAGGTYWQNTLNTGAANTSNITSFIASAAVDELYKTVLGRTADAEGKAYWQNLVSSGTVDPTQIDELFKQAAQKEINGFSTGGYTGDMGINDIAGVVHGQEYVINAKTTQDLGLNNGGGGVFKDMANEIKELRTEVQYLREVTLKTASETTRTSKLLDRVCPDGDALQVRITA